MSISQLIKTIGPRTVQYCSRLSELTKKLQPLGIDGMSYAVFQDTLHNSKIRSNFCYSSEELLVSYINDMRNWREENFYENQKYPLHKTT